MKKSTKPTVKRTAKKVARRSISPYRIDKRRYDEVLRTRICPGCGNHRVIDVQKVLELTSGGTKYQGSFHCCGSEAGHKCWYMTKYSESNPGRPLYEHCGS